MRSSAFLAMFVVLVGSLACGGVAGNTCGVPDPGPCGECLRSSCCAQTSACMADATCSSCILEGKQGKACQKNRFFQDAVACTGNACGAACGAGGGGGGMGGGMGNGMWGSPCRVATDCWSGHICCPTRMVCTPPTACQ